jgi:uncharacterized membrane protein affecting hemolysin expression
VRTKLTLLTIAVAVAILLVSTALVLRLSTHILDTQARNYANLLASQVARHLESLWTSTTREDLSTSIQAITTEHNAIEAIDVFFFHEEQVPLWKIEWRARP